MIKEFKQIGEETYELIDNYNNSKYIKCQDRIEDIIKSSNDIEEKENKIKYLTYKIDNSKKLMILHICGLTIILPSIYCPIIYTLTCNFDITALFGLLCSLSALRLIKIVDKDFSVIKMDKSNYKKRLMEERDILRKINLINNRYIEELKRQNCYKELELSKGE